MQDVDRDPCFPWTSPTSSVIRPSRASSSLLAARGGRRVEVRYFVLMVAGCVLGACLGCQSANRGRTSSPRFQERKREALQSEATKLAIQKILAEVHQVAGRAGDDIKIVFVFDVDGHIAQQTHGSHGNARVVILSQKWISDSRVDVSAVTYLTTGPRGSDPGRYTVSFGPDGWVPSIRDKMDFSVQGGQ